MPFDHQSIKKYYNLGVQLAFDKIKKENLKISEILSNTDYKNSGYINDEIKEKIEKEMHKDVKFWQLNELNDGYLSVDDKYYLGCLYFVGIGFEKNLCKAVSYWHLAYQQGHELPGEFLKKTIMKRI